MHTAVTDRLRKVSAASMQSALLSNAPYVLTCDITSNTAHIILTPSG